MGCWEGVCESTLREYLKLQGENMKIANKIAMVLVAVFGIGMMFSGCEADATKAPEVRLWEFTALGRNDINITSRDDNTIINNVTLSGRDGKCDITTKEPLGSKILYNHDYIISFDPKKCPKTNGKYILSVDTNFGTYSYEVN